MIRVTPDLTLQLAPWGTEGGWHLAFALLAAPSSTPRSIGSRPRAFPTATHSTRSATCRARAIEAGARGDGETVYFFDPNQHLIEIRHYDG